MIAEGWCLFHGICPAVCVVFSTTVSAPACAQDIWVGCRRAASICVAGGLEPIGLMEQPTAGSYVLVALCHGMVPTLAGDGMRWLCANCGCLVSDSNLLFWKDRMPFTLG